MKYENEFEIDLGRCARALVERWRFILLMGVICCVIGFALTVEKGQDQYTASSSVYAMSTESYNYTQQGVSAMNAYVDIATSMKVCERAALLMGYADITGETVMNATTVSTGQTKSETSSLASDSTIIRITSITSNPVISMEMAQAVAEAFTMEMENILGTDTVQILDAPYTFGQSFDATQYQWIIRIVALFAGIAVAMVIVVMMEIFDNKANTIRECTLKEQLPIIGVIPDYKDR